MALILAFSAVSTVSFAKGEALVTADAYKENLVTGLNLVNKKLSEKENITRADFALILMTLINEPVKASGATSYTDVTGSTKETAAIELARGMGLMVGVGENLFAPDQPILYSQAVKLILKATKNVREFNGEEVITGENQRRLTKGIVYADYEAIDYDTLVKLLYNALSVTVLEASFDQPGTMSASVDAYETLPEYFFDYTRVRGVLQADAYSSILTAYGNGETVTINGADYKSTADYNDLLGFKVDGFVDEDKNVVCVVADEDNSVMKLNTRNAVYKDKDQNGNPITKQYSYDNEGRYKTVQIKDGLPVVYNDRAMTTYSTERMLPENGYTMLIDNNDDGEIDIVRIIEYVNLNVQGASTEENKTQIFDATTGVTATLLTDADAETTVILDTEGNTKEIKNIRAGVVVSVIGDIIRDTSNPPKVVSVTARRAILSTNTIEGTLDLVDETEKTITVSGEVYAYDSNFKPKDISYGRGYVFALDFTGKITAANVADADDIPMGIAYVIDASLNNEDRCVLKVVTPYDKIIKYTCAEKVKIEGKDGKERNHQTIKEYFKDPAGDMKQGNLVIGYTVDEERYIDKIVLPQDTTGPAGIEQKFGIYKSESAEALTWDVYFNAFMSRVLTDESTIIFAVPISPDASTEDTEYKAIKRSDMKGGDSNKYKADAYVFNNKSNYADIVVVKTGVEETVSSTGTPLVVKSFKPALTEDDEVVFEVTVVENVNYVAVEKTYIATTSVIGTDSLGNNYLKGTIFNTQTPKKIYAGDVIAMATDARGEITAIDVLASGKDNTYVSGDEHSTEDRLTATMARRILRRNVYSLFGDRMTLVEKNIEPQNIKWADMESPNISRAAIVVIEEDAGKTQVRAGSTSDIDTYKEKGKSSDVLVHIGEARLAKLIVVYK